MLPAIIIIFWILVFLFCIYKFKIFNVSGIKKQLLIAAFIFKIALGCLNFYIWQNVIGHGDSLRYFNDSKLVYSALNESPKDYLKLVFGYNKSGMSPDLKYYEDRLNIAWTVPEYHMVRINAILNVFTMGNAYGNIIILSFIYFLVLIIFIKTLFNFNLIDTTSRMQTFILLFLPSVVFWCSGILKEGPVLTLLCIIIIQCLHLEKILNFKRLIYLITALFFLFLVRDYLMALIIPNLILWFIVRKNSKHAIRIFSIVSTSFISMLLIVAWLQPQLNVILWLKNEQNYFLLEPPDQDYTFSPLTGQVKDVIKKTPYAVNNILFRPNLFHSKDLFRIYISFELICIWLLIIWFVWNKKSTVKLPLTYILMLFFSIELMIAYGLITTDADTLSRYRSVPLFFILVMVMLFRNSKEEKDMATATVV